MKTTNPNLEQTVEFADNPESRCPCMLVLDVSGSMVGKPIEALNSGIHLFRDELKKDELASKRVEIGCVTFGSEVAVVQNFVTVDEFLPPALVADGATSMGGGIEKALDEVTARKTQYRNNGVAYYRPWVFLITDGEATDDLARATERIKKGEASKQFSFFAVGVEGANMEKLRGMSVREPIKLNGLDFKSMFVWLSASMGSVAASKMGDQAPLPPVDWAKV